VQHACVDIVTYAMLYAGDVGAIAAARTQTTLVDWMHNARATSTKTDLISMVNKALFIMQVDVYALVDNTPPEHERGCVCELCGVCGLFDADKCTS
jgi:hypothetical protein